MISGAIVHYSDPNKDEELEHYLDLWEKVIKMARTDLFCKAKKKTCLYGNEEDRDCKDCRASAKAFLIQEAGRWGDGTIPKDIKRARTQ